MVNTDGNPYLQVINVHDFKLNKDVYELYWQDGNSVTVPVIRAIAEKIAEVSKD